MKRVFVSGCFDILHAGHLAFLNAAKGLGDFLTVSFASEEVLWAYKHKRPSLPDAHKKALLESLRMVDEVVVATGLEPGLDFKEEFIARKPHVLAATADDQFSDKKRSLCESVGASYVVLPKTPPPFDPVSTSSILQRLRAPVELPLRVDFAVSWLDSPRFARKGAYLVNCAISPLVSLHSWPYRQRAGLGGSGAWAWLNGKDAVQEELASGVGWQDAAVTREGGLCVWWSGAVPKLAFKRDGSNMLGGRMALLWTGCEHDSPRIARLERDVKGAETAGALAAEAVLSEDIELLAEAVRCSNEIHLREGMTPLPVVKDALAWKYCGSGWGGYALYLFKAKSRRDAFVRAREHAMAAEPWCG
jgi:cytidyltransferase-like protein